MDILPRALLGCKGAFHLTLILCGLLCTCYIVLFSVFSLSLSRSDEVQLINHSMLPASQGDIANPHNHAKQCFLRHLWTYIFLPEFEGKPTIESCLLEMALLLHYCHFSAMLSGCTSRCVLNRFLNLLAPYCSFVLSKSLTFSALWMLFLFLIFCPECVDINLAFFRFEAGIHCLFILISLLSAF